MGYETRIHVFSEFTWDHSGFRSGNELATIDLCKCGNGAVSKLIADHTKLPKNRLWGIQSRATDKLHEALNLLREVVDNNIELSTPNNEISKIIEDVEDGSITKDCYGEYLAVIDIDDFILALEEDVKTEYYRRFIWALNLLKSIRDSWTNKETLKIVSYGH